jgi:hypothetical protein
LLYTGAGSTPATSSTFTLHGGVTEDTLYFNSGPCKIVCSLRLLVQSRRFMHCSRSEDYFLSELGLLGLISASSIVLVVPVSCLAMDQMAILLSDQVFSESRALKG